ncbi:MAG: translocation/assembly module TamB domain-containing protein [Lysobacteraceae bacterium]
MSSPSPAQRSRRWRAALLLLAAFLLLLFSTPWMLLQWAQHSVAGRDELLALAQRQLGSEHLHWTAVDGVLSDGVRIDGLRYVAEGLEVFVEHANLRATAELGWPLRLNVQALDLQQVQIRTWPSGAAANAGPAALPALDAPLDLALHASVTGLAVQSLTTSPSADSAEICPPWIEHATLQLALRDGRLHIEDLHLRSGEAAQSVEVPQSSVRLQGDIDTTRQWQHQLTLQWLASASMPAGWPQQVNAALRGDLRLTQMDLQAQSTDNAQQLRLQLAARDLLQQPTGQWQLDSAAWTLPVGDEAIWQDIHWTGELSGASNALLLQTEAVARHGDVRFELAPMQAVQTAQGWQIEGMQLKVGEGLLTASGQLATNATQTHALQWHATALRWPMADLGEVQIDGDVKIEGPTDALQMHTDVVLLRPPHRAAIQATAALQGSHLAIPSLQIDSGRTDADAHGRLEGSAELDWADGWQWQLDAQAQQLNPALGWPDWAGSLSAQLQSEGRWQDDRTEGRLQVRELQGQLQDTALAGEVELHWQARDEAQLSAALNVGSGRLRGDLSLADELQGEWRLQDWDLAALRLPGMPMQGRIEAHLGVSGTRDAPRLDIDAKARDLAVSGLAAKTLTGQGRLGWGGDAPLRFDVSGSELSLAGQALTALAVQVDGRWSAQQWQARLQTAQGELTAQAHGGGDASAWSGTLDRLQVSSVNPRWASWNLRQAVVVQMGDSTRITPFCIDNGAEARLCAQVDWPADGEAIASAQLNELPWGSLSVLLSPEQRAALPVRLAGSIHASVMAARSAQGALSGEMRLDSALAISPRRGSRDAPPVLQVPTLSVVAAVDAQGWRLQSAAELFAAETRVGQWHVDLGVASLQDDALLQGEAQAQLTRLDWLEALSRQALVNVQGRFDLQAQLGGSLAQPQVQGAAQVQAFAAELPAAGIRLQAGHAELQGAGSQWQVAGEVTSGQPLRLTGTLDFRPEVRDRLLLRLEGEQVELANTPNFQLLASPAVDLSLRDEVLRLRGTVGVPRALIKLDGMDSTVSASPDVVVLDPASKEASVVASRVDANLTFALGDAVRLEGFGLKGNVAGDLRVRERPGRATTGSGSLNVTGRYRAYGQDLEITRGRLSFATSPIDNPGLDIRAERRVDSVTAGIRLLGTAKSPNLTVWSDPAMDSSEALSYLVLGRPLRSASGADGRQLDAAATALGAGGNFLAEQLGTRLGLDQAGVADSEALGGAALTVGKYLSPRLLLSYGVSLFGEGQVVSLNYLINEAWNLQIDASPKENRGSINYRRER